jgi:hypothetical protein
VKNIKEEKESRERMREEDYEKRTGKVKRGK